MDMHSDAAKRDDYRQNVRKMGKKEFTLFMMQLYGFWPKDLPTPYDRQNSETPEDFARRKALLEEYDKLAAEIAKLYEDKVDIRRRLRELAREYDQTWDAERIRKDVAKQIMQESIARRAERKRQREEERRRRSEAWQKRKAEHIVFIGKGYSGGLCHRETNAAKLLETGLPVIEDDHALAALLGVDLRELRFLCYHRDVVTVDQYHRYTIPKKKGGERSIAAPKPLLKKVQRAILSGILERVPVAQEAHGFIKGRSVITGAGMHQPRPALLVNLDIADFFPSITFSRVRGLFQSLGYCGYVASLLAMLCTDCDRMAIEVRGQTKLVKTSERVLPQGSPASPAITNLLCRSLDRRIRAAAEHYHFTYSRYADDISLSFATLPDNRTMREAVHTVMCAVENEGFRINPDKTRYLRASTRQVVTGIVINGGQPGVPRKWVRELRAMLHNAAKQKEAGSLAPETLHEIRGRAAWLASVNAARYEKLIAAAGQL